MKLKPSLLVQVNMESEMITETESPSTSKTGFEVNREHTQKMLLEVSDEEEVSSDDDISFMCDKELSSDDGSTNNECTTHPGSDMMVVHWHQLKQLFKLCSQCGSTAKITKITSTGALISVSTECNLGHNNIWNSLPKEGQFYEGHTTLAASILLSGLTYQRFRQAMDIANVQFFSKNTFIVSKINFYFLLSITSISENRKSWLKR